MHPAARMGYLELIFSQWQSDDCSVSADPLDLAELSGLGDELWATYSARILRNFETLENGRLRNLVCFEEWQEAKRIFDAGQAERDQLHQKRQEAGKRGALSRWTHSKPMANGEVATDGDSKPEAKNALTGTVTGTETGIGGNAPAAPTPPARPIPVVMPKPIASAGGNGEFMAANWLGEELGIAFTRGELPVVAKVIQFEARNRGDTQAAAEFIRDEALKAQAALDRVDFWWIKDRKWNAQERDIYAEYMRKP